MHIKRLITAAVLIPPIYFYITKLPPVYFSVLIAVLALAGLWEYLSMYKVEPVMLWSTMVLGAMILVSSVLAGMPSFEIFAFVFLGLAVLRLFIYGPENALRDLSAPVIGLIYIPGLVSYQMLLREAGAGWIIFLFGTVWIADSAAFYVGSTLGRHKLYPAVSPKKTVEGGIGSVLGGTGAAIGIKFLFSLPLSLGQTAVVGLVLGITAILGDLVESMFKRNAGVKDSSHIIPGHGGILDKLDGSLFSAPILYWLLIVFGANA